MESTPIYKGGGKGTLCLFWEQILALDSFGKDPNCWLKSAIMTWKSWELKLVRLTTLERRRGSYRGSWSVRPTLGCRTMSDQFYAILSLSNLNVSPEFQCLFYFGHWSLIYANWPLNFQFSLISPLISINWVRRIQRLFQNGHWLWISSIWPLIDPKLLILLQFYLWFQ